LKEAFLGIASQKHIIMGVSNGKAMNKFMISSQEIMDGLSAMLQHLPAVNRCQDVEELEVTSKFKSALHAFYFIFQRLRSLLGLSTKLMFRS
jgi:hypothetical protein